jgi:hypothetical protein
MYFYVQIGWWGMTPPTAMLPAAPPATMASWLPPPTDLIVCEGVFLWVGVKNEVHDSIVNVTLNIPR